MRYLTPAVRDAVLFIAGLAGIVYVTVTDGGDRPTLLILFGGMIGLPAFLRVDEKKNADKAQDVKPDA